MSLFFRNLGFTILQPGIVAKLVSFLLSGKKMNMILTAPYAWLHNLGFILLLICISRFALRRNSNDPDDWESPAFAGGYIEVMDGQKNF